MQKAQEQKRAFQWDWIPVQFNAIHPGNQSLVWTHLAAINMPFIQVNNSTSIFDEQLKVKSTNST